MRVLLAASVVLALDILTKWLVQTRMALGESIPLIPGVFHLTYVLNPGAAFGILQDRRLFFIAVALLTVGAIVFFATRMQPRDRRGFLPLALGLLLGGAMGNLIDRIRFGQVIDFFDFRVWPVFNVADSAITVGVGLLIFYLYREGAQEKKARRGG